ncbi:hypothetical protein [Pseudonocardia abyssalis]|jgi:hypothetical protein|uniref:Uncharacterized protein n=1 Tax=Pseudonocardia abyssalis TaxID=2792008 RepID=A0ABS6UNF2_9PSEU|nr:hypothetical protein [Pseudonocardia abyssalis]MBW0116209.1 hypothetical protein [Pseudonocardia abyssalis]MBW0133334.1 hypothetical protein [Pseudonocardia abyssalis]
MRRIARSIVLLAAAAGLVLGGLGEPLKPRGPLDGGSTTNGNTAWG